MGIPLSVDRIAMTEAAVTRFRERQRADAIRALSALPRALFTLHNFYDMGVEQMAERLETEDSTIATFLAEARAAIHGYHPNTKMERAATGEVSARLESRLRQDYRDSLAETFASCGYGGAIEWPDTATDIAADENAGAEFVTALLDHRLRDAVAAYRRPNVAIIDLWRWTYPWQRRRRKRLLSVADALRCSGWRTFDVWLADRIAPDLHYPCGYADSVRLRRPLPGEPGAVADDNEGLQQAKIEFAPSRLDGLDALTLDTFALFQHYGRGNAEIGRLLGISRRSVARRIRKVTYAILNVPDPSIPHRMAFDLRCRWQHLRRHWRDICEVLRD